MVRILLRVVGCLVGGVLLFAAADYLVWQHHLQHGVGLDEVQVTRMSIAPLKSKKEEYYFDGTDTVPCSRSTLPMPSNAGWLTPCWWLREHHSVETRY
jgi:hypothetical protein